MIARQASNDILQGAQYFPVVAILGPRQSGKTTLAQTLFKNHLYLSLEDPDIRTAALRDPRTFLLTQRTAHGMIIDEFQYAPELLSFIQTLVDKEQKPGHFILTGSQNFLMNKAITQSLAGRVSIHTLLPLSTQELEASNLLPAEIEPMLFQGCYPAVYSKGVPPTLLYKNYLQTYVERDVRELTQVGNLLTFQTFIALCAARVGQVVNFTALGNDCGVSDNTAQRWLTILQASYIVFFLAPYHTNFGKRITKNPKLYFYDPGLVCHLLNIKQEEVALHPNKGNIFESFIIADIMKWYYNHSKTPRAYFWRDQGNHEIDCVLDEGQSILPVEIKSGRTVSPRFFDGLQYWHKITGAAENKGVVIFGGNNHQATGHANVISWQSLYKILK